MKYKQLMQVCRYINTKTDISNIDKYNYISTENMLQDKAGVSIASTIPLERNVSSYKYNDILISNIRPYFKKIWIATKDGGCSNDVLVIRVNKDIDPHFLYYVLSDNNFFNYATVTSKGTKMPRGSKTAIMKYLIPDIELLTQQKIADILSAYDDLIENNNRRIELLEKAAQDLYKEWFVRFRFPNYKQTKFDNGLPQGWEVVKIGDIVNITSSKRVYLSDYVESGIPFYRSKEVIQLSKGQAITEQLYISEEKYFEFRDKYGVPQKNDILLTSVGTIGIPMLVSNSELFYFKDGNLTWIQSSSNIELSYYLFAWLNSEIGKQQIFSSTIGTSQSALTIENLKNIKIIKPMNEIIIKYKKFSEEILNEINNLQNQNNNLIKQRDLLLPRLMSGKLEVK